MTEATLRKGHRYIGISLAIFILLQAASGIALSFWSWNNAHDHSLHATAVAYADEGHHHDEPDEYRSHVEQHMTESNAEHVLPQWLQASMAIHAGGGFWGGLYRIIIGLGIIGMALSGSMIFFKTQKRLHAAQQ